jgi:Fe-S oxidoreductase
MNSARPDLILINPTLSYDELYGGVFSAAGNHHVSLGLPYLAAAVRTKGYSVEIIDGIALQVSLDGIADQVLAKNPKYVGFTGVSIQIYPAVYIAQKIRQKNKEVKIIVGGPHLSALPQETLQAFPVFDVGVYGEGEVTIIELLQALDSGKSLDGIPGLIIRKNGKVQQNEPRSLIQNLDDLPLPAWDLLPELKKYYGPPGDSLNRLPASALMSSRGCPYQCTFCDRSVFGNRCRIHSAEYIMKMIRKLYHDFGIREVVFNDDNLVVFRKQLIDLCNMLIKEKLKISWVCLGSVNAVDEELLKLMKKAGCWQIMWGIETGSEELLKMHKKPANLTQIRKALEAAHKAGIRNKGFFILGLYHETEESLKQTLKFMLSLPLDEMHNTYLQPYPNTEVWKTADKYGSFNKDWKAMGAMTPNFVAKDLTAEMLERYQKQFYLKFYLRPRIMLYFLWKCRRPSVAIRILRIGLDLIKVIFMALIPKVKKHA